MPYLDAVCDDPALRQPEGDTYWQAFVALNAAAVGEDAEAVAFARAVLLADGMNGQVGPDSMTGMARRLERLPRSRAAAIRRGIIGVAQAKDEGQTPVFDASEVVSVPRDVIVSDLVQVARQLDAASIQAIALADYGLDADRHAEALRDVLRDPACRFPKGDRWYPAEVVELVGHVPSRTLVWHGCMALLILDDIHSDGAFDQLTFRWMRHAEVFLTMDDPFRVPLLRGIRHVMEGELFLGWDPYFDRSAAEIAGQPLVPWEDAADPA